MVTGIKTEIDLSDRILDGATRLAFKDFPVDNIPATVPAPLFKIGECVRSPRTVPRASNLGGKVKAVAWKGEYKSYVYKLDSKAAIVFKESELMTSKYGVDDTVKVSAFGSVSDCTIEDVYVIANGVFSYGIGGGFKARDEDILEIVARRG